MPNMPDFQTTFDARDYEPPSWAAGHLPKAKSGAKATAADEEEEQVEPLEDDEDEEEELRKLGLQPDNESVKFTTEELVNLLSQATSYKEQGNKLFTASPKRLEEARDAYKAALTFLPDVPEPVVPVTGVQEITDEEAEELNNDEGMKRREVESDIRSCTKAVWGNLGAVYLSLEEWKETVEACSKALEIDGEYTKALHRRAQANEKIGSWSSLTAALEDYKVLVSLVPSASPQLRDIRKALESLPARIGVQQEKEKDEMIGKLKDLGNSLLGKFGLSTDMFKFEQGEGGGYNMKFGN